MGKVKFGLRDFEYGVLDDKETATKTAKLPGMKSAKLDITNEIETIMADDGPYVTLSAGITDVQLEIQNLDLNTEARKDFYNITVEKGVEKYNKNLTPNDVAVIFRTSMEDGKAIWIGLPKGKFNVPGMEVNTKEGTPDPQADTVTGKFVARGGADDGDVLYIGREDNEDFKLEEFKKMMFPTASGIGG